MSFENDTSFRPLAADDVIEARIYRDLWIEVRVTSADSIGGIDAVDDEGCIWSFDVSQRLDAWRFLDDPRDPMNERRALVNLCMMSGLREERTRVLEIIRVNSPGGIWTEAPAGIIAAIQSGEMARAAVPLEASRGD